MKKFHSNDLIPYYDETYFLGGKSKYTGQTIGVEGYKEFSEGKILQKKIDVINLVDFKNKIVLDIGFGRGEVLKYCYENGAKECVGIDYAIPAFMIASNYVPQNVQLFICSVDRISIIPNDNIQIIYMMDILEHVPNEEWEECFNQLKPKLNKDCELIAITPSVPSGDYLQMHNNYQTKDSLNKLLGKYFNNVEIKDKDKWFYIKCKGIK